MGKGGNKPVDHAARKIGHGELEHNNTEEVKILHGEIPEQLKEWEVLRRTS